MIRNIKSSSIVKSSKLSLTTRDYSKEVKLQPLTALFYKYVPDVLEKRGAVRMVHLVFAAKAKQEGKLLYGGAFDPVSDGAMLVFNGDCKEYVENFAKNDPYVTSKLVSSYEIKKWNNVALEAPEYYQE
jgi:uncharacterized protein YciI